MEKNLENFIHALYDGVETGVIGVTYFKTRDNKNPETKWFELDKLDDIPAYVRKVGEKHNTYIDLSPRKMALPGKKRGEAKDVASVVGLYIDVDTVHPVHAEKHLPQNSEAFFPFLEEAVPQKPSFVVSTGHGLQIYWLFSTPFLIQTADDTNKIQAILKGFSHYVIGRALKEKGWKLDNVSDIARMLRAPDTQNVKAVSVPCEILSAEDFRYMPEDFASYVQTDETYTSPIADDDYVPVRKDGDAWELVELCPFLQHCRDDAADLPYDDWFAMISILAQTENGREVIHELSSPYIGRRGSRGYSAAETDRKIKDAKEHDAPHTCARIKEHYDCGKNCGVKSPICLLRANWEKPEEKPVFVNPEFPVDALPPVLADYVRAVAKFSQVYPDLPAVCVLGAIAGVAQGKYVVKDTNGQTEPVCLYIMSAMRTGDRKSSVMSLIQEPIEKYQIKYNREHSKDFEARKSRKSILEQEQHFLQISLAKKYDEATQAKLDKVNEEIATFQELHKMRLTYSDVTPEALASAMYRNNERAIIMTAEGSTLNTLAGSYSQKGIANLDIFLNGYTSDITNIERKGSEPISIVAPKLTIVFAVQPLLMEQFIANNTFAGRGLVGRFLFTSPPSTQGTRKPQGDAIPEEVSAAYANLISRIMDNECAIDEPITISSEAREVLDSFHYENEDVLGNIESDTLGGWRNRLIGNTKRIAGLLYIASNPDICTDLALDPLLAIDAETMERAIQISRYFCSYADYLFSEYDVSPDEKYGRQILRTIKKQGKYLTTKREMNRMIRGITAKDLDSVLDWLVTMGYIAPAKNKQGTGRPSEKYKVNPWLFQ